MPERKTPNFIQRVAKAARYIFRPIVAPKEVKKSPFSNTTIGLGNNPQYSQENVDSYYHEGYQENSLIYSAITYKAKSITQAKLKVYKYTDKQGNYDLLEFGNDLQKLLDKPNRYQSAGEFHTLQNVFFNLTGNAFTYLERKGKNVVALWPLNPAFVRIIPDDKGEILGYDYKPYYHSGEPFPIRYEDMAHWKLPNPNDPLNGLGFGMSPVLAMAQAGDVDNMISRFLSTFFKHGALPSGLLKFKDLALDENEINAIREKWASVYGGYDNWSDVGILDMYGEYQRIGFTFAEMDFGKLDQRNETRIFATLGVPLELLPTVSGLTGSTYNNKSEARAMFWQDTMIYELNVVEKELARFFDDEETGIFIQWDLSDVYALKGDVAVQVEAASKLYAMKVPPRIAFEAVGLSIPDYDGIDDAQPNQMDMFNAAVEQNTDPTGKPKDDEENTNNNAKPEPKKPPVKNLDLEVDINENFLDQLTKSSFDLETKKKIYKQFDEMIVSHEPQFLEAALSCFEFDRKNILAILTDVKTKALNTKASIEWDDATQPVEWYLFGESRTNWRNYYTPVIEGMYKDTSGFWNAQLGLQFDIRNLEGELALDQYTLVFSEHIAKTNSDSIKTILQYGYRDGSTIEQMTNRINSLYDDWSEWRGELIARTETTRAANDGARKLYKRWGVEQKEWLSTADDRTRQTHLDVNGQVVDIDEPFKLSNGVELMQPGDSSAPLSETAACRCTVLPVLDKSGKVEDTIQQIQETIAEQEYYDYLANQEKSDSITRFDNFQNGWKDIILGKDFTTDMREGFHRYTQNHYEAINSYLRGISKTLSRDDRNSVKEMNKDFNNPLGERLTLRRGMDDVILKLTGVDDPMKLKGVQLQDMGYMSTSVKKGFKKQFNIEILAEPDTKGAYINSISAWNTEYEFLLPPGTTLEFIDVIDDSVPGFTKSYRLIARIVS